MNKKILYNPFYFVAGIEAFFIGLAGILATSYLAFYTGTHFSGFLSINFAKDSDLWIYALENFLHWAILSLSFYIAGIILSKSRFRMIDILGTALISRIPLIIVPIIRMLPMFQSFVNQSFSMYFLLCLYFFSLIWVFVLLFNAYKVSCNLKEERLIISFISAVVVSEGLTKIILSLIF